MQHTMVAPDIEELLVSFMQEAPVAIAIKRPLTHDSEIVWGNAQYLELIESTAPETFGRKTTDVLGIRPDHPIVLHEAEVVETGRARMSKERFHRHDERWSLRFPIYDHDGRIALIGVVSPDFLKADARSR